MLAEDHVPRDLQGALGPNESQHLVQNEAFRLLNVLYNLVD
jgi:hypothetical protein